MRKGKTIFTLVCLIAVLCTGCGTLSRKYTENELLEMPYEKLFSVLTENGLAVPEGYDNEAARHYIVNKLASTLWQVRHPIFSEGSEVVGDPSVDAPEARAFSEELYKALKQCLKPGSEAENGEEGLMLMLAAEQFRPTPQWLKNDYQQKQDGESLYVSFRKEGTETLFCITDLSDGREEQFPVEETCVFGDYIVWKDLILLFDQGTTAPEIRRSKLYAFSKDGALIKKVVFEDGELFVPTSGIAVDGEMASVCFMMITNGGYRMNRIDLNTKESAPAVIREWNEPAVIADAYRYWILVQTGYDEKDLMFREANWLSVA